MEIPEAAIEAANQAIDEWQGFEPEGKSPEIGGRKALQAALPALRKQWERELLSRESIEAAVETWDNFEGYESRQAYEQICERFHAAFESALRQEGSREVPDAQG